MLKVDRPNYKGAFLSFGRDEGENVPVEARKTTSAPSTMSNERRCLSVGRNQMSLT